MILTYLIIVFTSIQPSIQHEFEIEYYTKCKSDGRINEEYIFQSDSTITYQEFAEGLASRKRIFGHWSKRDTLITIESNKLGSIQYVLDSLEEFQFLINKTEFGNWKSLKAKLLYAFANDPEITSQESYHSTPEVSARVFRKIKYDLSKRTICGGDILLQIPEEIRKEHERIIRR